MSTTRQRLTEAALELFLSQGISHTTTRQIANMAEVNEATLFRNFGNKYGLLLAMLQESPALVANDQPLYGESMTGSLRAYASDYLRLLEQFPNFVRSIIGEADQYPPEHQEALRLRLTEIKQNMAKYLAQSLGHSPTALPIDQLANLLGALLVGYAVIETTGGTLWENRDSFLDAAITLLSITTGESAEVEEDIAVAPPEALVVDLPISWVHQVMKEARNLGAQDHALALVLFGAGLLPTEIIRLERIDQICDKSHHILRVLHTAMPRQVPVNQWILGKRYGSYINNPLTKWLKTRKDESAAMFINDLGAPMTLEDVNDRWKLWWQDLDVGTAMPKLIQARQTWCVEMVMRGMTLDNLSILTGCDEAALYPYGLRAREKAAIAAATQLDRKTP